MLTEQVSLLTRSSTAKNYLIDNKQAQIASLNEIILTKDRIIANTEAVNRNLKAQIAAERKKYFWYGAGFGAVVVGVVVAVVK